MPPGDSDANQSITIRLNGEPCTITGDARLTALLERLKMKRARVAVELNHEIVPRAHHADVVLKEGDHLEVINFVGGG